MTPPIEKVTAFITRQRDGRRDLLLFEHPHAGIQIPAGTVESGETPEAAVLREAGEETGLQALVLRKYLGEKIDRLPEGQRIVSRPTAVYSRPDPESFDWARLRTGLTVAILRHAEGFVQVKYEEPDRLPDMQYYTLVIQGWVPLETLTDTRRRTFFHLEANSSAEERWSLRTDNHIFTPFWSPLGSLPAVIPPQNEWLEYLAKEFPEVGGAWG